ncbi:MAG: YigZ family protein [Deltaproteobacteria bacterium]|nr:MAG: YigZ family protein [Deltaproteobacteria bacterium]
MARFSTVSDALVFEEDLIKGSRFVALVEPVDDEEQALAHVDACRTRWPGATHHCWAFALADGRTRSSDDGEPGGSAGRPILAQIEGHGVTNVAVVVVRWYGGTKLGVGGLIRAYGGTAGKALDRCDVVEVIPRLRLVVAHSYDDTGPVQAVVGSRGLEVVDTQWGAGVRMTVSVTEEEAEAVTRDFVDRTAGRADVTVE